MNSPKTKKSKSRRTTIWLARLLVILILALILFRNYLKSNLDQDEYKSVLEFVIIIFGGGFIGIAFDRIKKEQELREVWRKILQDFYSKVVLEYNKVKKCRRMLRALAIEKDEKGEPVYLRINECIPILSKLEDSQLEFEAMRREVDKVSFLFTDKKTIADKFTLAEKYLAKVLEKFEAGEYYGINSKEFLAFDRNVKEFTKHYEKPEKDEEREKYKHIDKNEQENSSFFTGFAFPFDDLSDHLIKDIQKI